MRLAGEPIASERELKASRIALQALVDEARALLPFTGAGISTECGIPDFRSPGGLWAQNRPIDFGEFLASDAARREAWRRRFAMEPVFSAARPGRGHRAIAAWIGSGKGEAVITQNVDGLHHAAGLEADEVIEIHGNTRFATCLDCGTRHELDWIRQRFETAGDPPSCRSCDGLLKTATISFGQPMPEKPMRRAIELAARCDLFIAIGSSLIVHPAASLPVLAKKGGARLVIINREATPLDSLADLVLRGEIGEILDG
jgi:NAD-dependent deacetylase